MKSFLLDLFFPSFCINCGKEGNYLCQDCLALIDISEYQYCPFCKSAKIVLDGKTCKTCKKHKKLKGLYCATSYQNFVVKKMLKLFKYSPFIKELAKPLSFLIIAHFQILNKSFPQNLEEKGFVLIPVPLHKRKLKWRGFNQAEELAKELSLFFKIPLIKNVLIKTKETLPQVELKEREREENIKNAFQCVKPESIKKRKILLVDDVFTTGATMEECAKVLKQAGAKEIYGIAIARG